MAHVRRSVGIVCAFLMALAAAGGAGEPDQAAQAFESLYGSDVKRVRATREAADDIELAARLLAAAKEATGQPAFLAVLCERAADLAGSHPDGVATAVEAMDFLTSQVPEKAGACAERVLTIRQKQFEVSRGAERPAAGEALIDALLAAAEHKQAAGAAAEAVTLCRRAQAVARGINSPRAGEIDARQKALAEAMKTEREIADIKALLGKNPQNTALREKLVRIYLVQKDAPAKAAKHLEGVKDASLRKYVPAAAKGAEAAPELACQELGEWYRGLAEAAPDAAKAAMYARAKAYYERFLELHTPEDLARTTASLARKKVQAELDRLGCPAAPATAAAPTAPTQEIVTPGRWVNALALVDPAKDAVAGAWERRGVAIRNTDLASEARILVPVAVRGDYELQVKFVRTQGNDCVVVVLPAGSTGVCLGLSVQKGKVSGLSTISGKSCANNETTVRPGALENGKEHQVRVKVTTQGGQTRITVLLDGKPYIGWRGPASALAVYPLWRLPRAGCPGLGVRNSSVVLRGAWLKMLSGEARLLRPATTAAKTPSTAKPTPAPSGKTVRTGQWVDLARHAVKGTWEERDGVLVLTDAPHNPRVMIPAVPLGNYELEVTCRRTWGDSTMAIILPVASTGVAVSLDYDHGSASGLDRVNGESPKDNGTRVKAVHMKGKREYVVHSKVQVAGPAAQIDVTLDGEPYIAWKGPLAALSMPKHWQLPTPQAIGLGAFFSRAQFRNIRLKMLTGRAILPPAKK